MPIVRRLIPGRATSGLLVLAALGGTDAFHVLLEGLVSSNAAAANAAALAVRRRVKDADAKQRRGYLAETERFLQKAPKTVTQSKGGSGALAAAVKILGYLEDPRAVPMARSELALAG